MKIKNRSEKISSGSVFGGFLCASIVVLAAVVLAGQGAYASNAAPSVLVAQLVAGSGAAKETPPFVVRGMLKAVRKGKLPLLKAMMKSATSPDVSLVDKGLSVTALRLASSMGRAGFVTYLLEKGAKPDLANENRQTALMMASKHGDDAIVRMLREKGAVIELQDSSGRTAADYARDAGHTELAASLNPDLPEQTKKVQAVPAEPENPAPVPAPEAGVASAPKPPSAPAVTKTSLVAVADPVEKPSKQPIKAIPQTPKSTGESTIPKTVSPVQTVTKEPEVSAPAANTPKTSKQREFPIPATLTLPAKGKPTPAFMAKMMVKTARDEKLKMLAGVLKGGADPNVMATVDGKSQTPLIAAAEAGRNEAVTLLLENGAAINLAGSDGRSALMVAASKGYQAVVENLISQGAHAAVQDGSGETAAQISEKAGFDKLADYLKRAEQEHLAYLPKEPAAPIKPSPSLPAASVSVSPENPSVSVSPEKMTIQTTPTKAVPPPRPAPPPAPKTAMVMPAPAKIVDGGLAGIEQLIGADWYTQKNANIRNAPSSGGMRMGTIARGQPVHVVGKMAGGEWMAVKFAGTRGYIASFLVAPSKPVAALKPVKKYRVSVSGKVVVLNTANLMVNGKKIVLHGVQGIDGNLADGMGKFIISQGGRANCTPKGKRKYLCKMPSGVDIAEAAILNGAARTTFDAPKKYKISEDKARTNRRGVWGN